MKRAILIGITYCNSARKTLSGSWGDITIMQSVLRDYDEVITLFDEKHDTKFLLPTCPTKETIISTIRAEIKNSQPDDTLLIYFSGHAENISDNRLITADDKEITSAEFTELIMLVKSSVMVRIILDCTNSGKLLRLPYRYVNPGSRIEMPILCKKNIILLTSDQCRGITGATNGELTYALSQLQGAQNWFDIYVEVIRTFEKFKKTPQLLTSNLSNLHSYSCLATS